MAKQGKEWSGLSESNRHLNLGKSVEDGFSRTYKASSVALSSGWSSQKRLMVLQLVPRGRRVGTLCFLNRERVQDSFSGIVSLVRESVIVSDQGLR